MGNLVCYESNQDDVVDAIDATIEGAETKNRADPAIISSVSDRALLADRNGDGIADALQDEDGDGIADLWTKESVQVLFALYDQDHNGFIDHREMRQLIIKCLALFVPEDQAAIRDEVIFSYFQDEDDDGIAEYAMMALSVVSKDEDGDGIADNVTFGTFYKWVLSPENFLLFHINKTRVMLWLFDLFHKFDTDRSGHICRQEFDAAIGRLGEEIGSESPIVVFLAEMKFEDFDCDVKDGKLSVKEMVFKALESWEQLYAALFDGETGTAIRLLAVAAEQDVMAAEPEAIVTAVVAEPEAMVTAVVAEPAVAAAAVVAEPEVAAAAVCNGEIYATVVLDNGEIYQPSKQQLREASRAD